MSKRMDLNAVEVCCLRFHPQDRALLQTWARKILGQQPARKIANEQRMMSHLGGRAAAAWLLTRCVGDCELRPDPDLGFLRVYDPSGRIVPNRYLNISHTEDRAVAVLSTHSVGVDIESAERDGTRVYRRVASEKELAHLASLPASSRVPPIALWSAKEAFSKAVGLGMNFGLQEFQIILEGSPPYTAATNLRGPLTIADPAVVFDVRDGYVISVCGEKTDLERGLRFTYLETADLRIL